MISSLEDSQAAVHAAAWHALDVCVKSIPKDELEPLVVPLRRSIENNGGVNLPKGVSPIIIAGLVTGVNEQRGQAEYATGDLVDEYAIKPSH